MKPDKDCYTFKLDFQPFGLRVFHVCRSRDLKREDCPYICEFEREFGLGNYFCNYPDRDKLPKG